MGMCIDMMGIEYEADVRRQRDEKRGVPFQHCSQNSTKRQGRNEDDLHLLAWAVMAAMTVMVTRG